jgi:hypothetical protein
MVSKLHETMRAKARPSGLDISLSHLDDMLLKDFCDLQGMCCVVSGDRCQVDDLGPVVHRKLLQRHAVIIRDLFLLGRHYAGRFGDCSRLSRGWTGQIFRRSFRL